MTVFIDDAMVAAAAGRLTSRWSQMIADDLDELDAFADRLGVRRAWFQDPTRTGKPRAMRGSHAGGNWHCDLTAGKRAQAICLGAVLVIWRDTVAFINRRYEES